MINPVDTIIRLLLGALLGGIIGFERQSHGRPAGFRTHLLVSLASVLIMIVSDDYYRLSALNPEIIRIDPARIAAGAITGIGFLGAGVIIKSGFTVQGLTTAACLWVVSAIGLAVGSGLYLAAIVTFIITIFALLILRKVETGISRLIYKVLTVTTEPEVEEAQIRRMISEKGAEVSNIDYEMDRTKNELTYHITISFTNVDVIKRLLLNLSRAAFVKRYVLRG